MKSILQSIQPQYCELIASGKKTIEVRKTKPNIPTPFKVYIYETKTPLRWNKEHNNIIGGEGGYVIGEYICNEISDYCYDTTYGLYRPVNEKGFFIIDNDVPLDDMCLNQTQLIDYGKDETLHGWHISDLKIYDKPKELNEFITPSKIGCCNEGKCNGCKWLDKGNGFNIEDDCFASFDTDEYKPLRRPPQSWCYVEEV